MILLPGTGESGGQAIHRQHCRHAQPWPRHRKVRPRPSAFTCNTNVAALSGASCEPAGSDPERRQRQRQGEIALRSAPARSAHRNGTPIHRAPPRRRDPARPAYRNRASVSSTAAVAGASGSGATRPPPTSQMRPGRAIASSTARKHAWAPATGSVKPGCKDCGTHERIFRMAKNCTLVAAAFAAISARRACCTSANGAITFACSAKALRRVLQHRIQDRRQLRLSCIAPGDIGVPHLPRLGPHRAARDGHLSQVERRAAAAGATTHHHQPGLRPTQPGIERNDGMPIQQRGEVRGLGTRQHRHPTTARGMLFMAGRPRLALVRPKLM